MVKASDKTGEGQSAEPADFSHLTDALKDLPHVPLHPLMAHPTAALAAATAIGFGFATHMTSVFFGSLHGALDATNKLARKLEEEQAKAGTSVEGAAETDATVEPAATVKDVKPRKAAQPKPATTKSAKPSATKTRPVEAKAKPAVAKAPVAKVAAEAKVVVTDKPIVAVKAARANGKADDLKKIEGVGPKLEQVLNGRGIRRFSDLAALDAAELEALDAAIGLDGRVVRDDWAGQARQLARGRK